MRAGTLVHFTSFYERAGNLPSASVRNSMHARCINILSNGYRQFVHTYDLLFPRVTTVLHFM